jgi:hypothetical protein
MVKHLLVENNLVERDLDDNTNKPKVYWQTISANWHCTFMTKDTHLDQLVNKSLKYSLYTELARWPSTFWLNTAWSKDM